MREKRLQCVVTFKTTTQAMAFEELAKKSKFSGRLIPLPQVIAVGCGVAWRCDPKLRILIESLMDKNNLCYDKIHEVVI